MLEGASNWDSTPARTSRSGAFLKYLFGTGLGLAALSLVLAIGPLQTVLSGSQGTALIPPIKNTGLTALTYSALLALGLAL